jgi:hypothetical protein
VLSSKVATTTSEPVVVSTNLIVIFVLQRTGVMTKVGTANVVGVGSFKYLFTGLEIAL